MDSTKQTMACPSCYESVVLKPGTWPFVESGLDNVILHGVKVFHCKRCGYSGPVINDLDGLMTALAQSIVVKPSAIRGSEIRFLRKHVKLDQSRFADRLRVDTGTLSKWETGKAKPGPRSDLLIRFVVTNIDHDLLERFQDLIEQVYKADENANRILLNAETREPEYTR